MTSTKSKTWLITGAGRGMGVDFAQAALAAGHSVVATGRNPETVARAVGEHDNLLVTRPFWHDMNGRQAGDPAKLAQALVQLADGDEPPLRWVAGEDAVEGVEQKARLLLAQADAHRELSTGLAHDDALVGA